MKLRALMELAGFNQQAIEPLSDGYGDLLDTEIVLSDRDGTVCDVFHAQLEVDRILLFPE
jgi:hypothetical protein